MDQALHFRTLAELSAMLDRREVCSVELTDALLERIAALDPQVNAFITVTAERARAQARAADAERASGQRRGPLHGVPFALKDIIDTAGVLTSSHSRICIDRVPVRDATVTRRLIEAGAVLLGKLSTHEFAHGGPSFDLPWPPARNPWDTEHFTGGSSSGAGAAVAAGFAPFALGTDTGGSIRTPAAFCGLAGLKPTYGRVSRRGVVPNAFSFDHVGPMAWTVEDCAMVLQAIAGHDPLDPGSAERPVPEFHAALGDPDLRGLRVGVLRHAWEEDVAIPPELAQATEAAIATLRELGAEVANARIRPLQAWHDVKTVISMVELSSIHHDDLRLRPGDFGRDFLGRGGLAGLMFQGIDYLHAQRVRRAMLDEMQPLYDRFDVLVTPGAGPAPRLDGHRTVSFWEKPSLFSPASVLGNPALIVCCGYAASGLPMGLQIAGRPFDEATVLRVGHAYERATAWRTRRPALVPGTPRPAVTLVEPPPPGGEIPPEARRAAEVFAHAAGVPLDDDRHAQLLRAAPHVLAMVARIRAELGRSNEPAAVFAIDPRRDFSSSD
ncbi:MAG: amidase [Pseudomonadota bacterium]